jgi:anthranilate synthase/aminodeoxychorismate synthase-like glutamine amidotransferase
VILLVDNYDSFTFNLVQALGALGAVVAVRRNDAVDGDEVARLRPEALVLSPGPGRPEDAGTTMELVERFAGTIPILGVCLGHQAIGLAFGARVGRAPLPVHGKSTPATHDGGGLFAGLPSPFPAGRYHSLAIEPESLPREFRVRALSTDGVIMAIEHDRFPLWGVQFHPESVLTPDGPSLLRSFHRRSRAWLGAGIDVEGGGSER